MFGISFSELLLVGLVALLVLGPERLPGAARTAGLWIGRLKRSFNAIKQEVEREIGADEIRRQLHNEHILSLEDEARKMFAQNQHPETAYEPVSPQPAPVQTDATDTGHNSLGPAEPAAPKTALSLEKTAKPADAGTPVPTPPAHDSSLPPRAP
ncbi:MULTISPECIES: Sec-independent protein translocase protein TatB [Pseudomonas syringae group]|uniref:Sec-independent protein translocase protein TatB n=6 Tax=Pseudomonas syringae group TaxID=136849 RepID=Q87UY6_PSESM|nr:MULTISPECIES: Sec-independent protein translocase protein TatB [Pseudomonas syringae group]KPC08756.1 Sec-independent protein translocase protein TatB [Pseudomonas amygdali pv. lachrymans]AAO58582.1 sec-independent protein translocase TatB [Pseudomonas syringae pv. tomato str. DC3000]EGH96113.1 sec-independent translocase [Pseudomonas amygdali pv. lachrymans str. M302278]KKI24276.1 preprotein translocase [Pseudomonas syringae pv. persicae]KPB92060.1 Sec-independent protein translocase prote